VIEIEAFGVSDAMLDRLRRVDGVASLAVEARDQAQVILVQAARGSELLQALLRELDGANVGRVASREPTLEDAYVELVQGA
jgi:ABC-2 type transport system ATP-binding protein